MKIALTLITAAVLTAVASLPAQAGPRDDIIASYAAAAGNAGDPAAGQAMFAKTYGTGKAETPSCTTCHGNSPFTTGQTRAGKAISPLAPSKTPDRFTEAKKVAKWFRRNCNSVIGRECTPQEKIDFLAYMGSQ